MKQHLNASNALSSLLLLLLQIILIFQTPTTTRAEDWEKTFIALRQCQNDSSNYTCGSKFKSNLVNHLLPTLVANGSRTGFLTASFGKHPDKVYGLVQCRGDICEEDCQKCLTTSSVEIIRTCPNKKSAGLQLSKCFIRYSNLRFFSKLDTGQLANTSYWSWENDQLFVHNPVVYNQQFVYNQQLEGLMTNLMSNASSIPSRFMTGSTSTKSDDWSNKYCNIYGLVQCTEDLSITDCLNCLQVMFDRSQECCSGKKGKWILSLSCQIRYEESLFFQSSSPPPLLLSPAPAPAPAPAAPHRSQPRASCDVYARCGSFGICNQVTVPSCDCLPGFNRSSPESWSIGVTTGGCVRKNSLQCGNKDGFLLMPNMKLPLTPPESLGSQVRSIEECQSACSNKCSCNAYSYGSSGCSLWDDLFNLQQLSDGDNTAGNLYLRLAASDIRGMKRKKKKSITAPLVGAVAGVLALLGLVLILVIWRCKKRRTVGASKSSVVEGSLVAFTYRDLQSATKNFSDKLGGGGFGSVFKGVVLPDSTAIAVKKLEGLSQGEKQFRSEVSTIGTIQHVNLVRLRGFCSEGTKRLLVYDYMPKGSLDAHLFHPKDSDILNWKTRYEIALGTARGLTYLHEKCRDCIIHCDIKPENILLDAEFCPKVADFGLAKLVGREFSRVLTTMRGTRGYLAPEWISGVAITAKADVYSYGMMLFEIISGRRNSAQSEDVKMRFFPTWAATKMTEGEDILSIADYRLEDNADVEELTRACRVACWCIQDSEAHRPTMGQVVQILEGVLDVNQPPIPRSLHVLVENQDNVFFLSDTTNRSSQAHSSTSSASSQAKSITSSLSSKS